ncbi:sugar phosphate nucleotidyltransferase [Caloranaerobacter sp. TR13]|uniref:sugar phosphate nucleotidyltransferase n=1 Tax=Caloranaerobacter sp. TR13 TaxID=1302151 RepID=UPI0006D423AA|nr:sugar phosphate nucleotidyltransferase [Caloranaerobacter sp. TR13]
MIIIKAVIMAGGKGTRLRPLTCDLPKPMVPILNKPVMEYSIELLRKYEITDIAVTLAYLPDVIINYFEDGSKWGVNIKYFIEEIPLGTGGSVKNAEEFLNDTFIVISGDALTDINLKRAIEFHKTKNSLATIVLKKEPVPLEYGVIITNEEGRIESFLEKPSWGEVFSDTINTGIYILEPQALSYYKKGDNFDFSKDLFPKLLKNKENIYGYIADGYWCDIGDLKSYVQTHFDILSKKVDIQLKCKEENDGVWIEEGVTLGDKVSIIPPVYIGKNTVIKEKVKLEPYTVIGDYCKIESSCSIKKSVLWSNVIVGNNSELRGTVICNNTKLEKNISTFEGSVVGKGCNILSGSIIKPNCKIWPDKKIEENTIINENLVWGTKYSKNIFGYRDIKGVVNIDITPEFASRLASAFASTKEQNGIYVVASDNSDASILIRKSLISGILSTGAGVIEIDNSVIPMSRFAIRYFKADGGLHVRSDNIEPDMIRIELLDGNGSNLNRAMERKVENLFNRGDFQRCKFKAIKKVMHIDNFYYYYIKKGQDILKSINEIKRENFRILISSRSEDIMKLAKDYLADLGCKVKLDYSIVDFDSTDDYLNYMSEKVRNGVYKMGIIYSENAENTILIDELGRIIDKARYVVLVSLVILKSGIVKNLVVPYNAPKVIDKIANKYYTNVIRSKNNPSDIINSILKIEDDEESIMLQYTLNFDGIWGTGKIIDYLVSSNKTLANLYDEIPDIHYIKSEVICDWQDKGRVIRQIIEENKDPGIEMFEGVRFNSENGWALILPDSERPVFNIYAEGLTEEYAKEISTFYIDKVKKILQNQGH